MNPDNLYDLLELVHMKIDEIYNTKWDMKDFIQTGTYKPSKNNVKLKTFVERMKTERGIDVKPNERFEYVLVQKYPYKYDWRGRKEALSIGDKIEFKEIAEKENMQVDLDYYMQGSINGQLARLITYHDMFNVAVETSEDTLNVDNADDIKSAEDQIYKNATKYIEDVCKKYYSNYNTFGKAYQKIFRQANKIIGGKVDAYDPLASTLLSANVKLDEFETWFINICETKALNDLGDYGVDFVEAELKKAANIARTLYNENPINADKSTETKTAELKQLVKQTRHNKINELQLLYFGNKTEHNIQATRTLAFKQTMSILRQRIKECYTDISTLYNVYHAGINNISNLIKDQLGINSELCKPTQTPTDYNLDDFNIKDVDMDRPAERYVDEMFQDEKVITTINKFKTLYLDIISAHTTYHKTCLIVEYLKSLRNATNKVIARPDQHIANNKEQAIKEMLKADIDF
jgi:hypothetical protein